MRVIAIIGLFLLIQSMCRKASLEDVEEGYFKREHSLVQPYHGNGMDVPFWGSTIITNPLRIFERTIFTATPRVTQDPLGVKSSLITDLDRASISRILGNGRSPKQISEESGVKINQKETSVVNNSQELNYTVKAHLDPLPSISGPNSLQILQRIIRDINRVQAVFNQDKFSTSLTNESIVLIVQVHRRDGYLKQLLDSLRVTKGIEDVLLVISHDYYYDVMNSLIRSINFCRVIQIFYPFSLQVIPTTFPGVSPNDCPRDISKEEAIGSNCTNAQHPDSYGHYREAVVTAIKHHWWWKVNMVFDHLRATQNHTGYVIFLEEDHYVAPDFLVVAKQLIQMKNEKCSDCDFINLGMYNKAKLSNRVSSGVWNAGKNNMGFGMNRETWEMIRSCSQYFCTYDDYNWDWSLNQLGKACPHIDRDLKVLVLKTARIFHIGTCGTHHHHKNCNEAQQAKVTQDIITKNRPSLFPDKLIMDHGVYPPPRKLQSYGGWGDIRDHQLCMKIAQKDAAIDGSEMII